MVDIGLVLCNVEVVILEERVIEFLIDELDVISIFLFFLSDEFDVELLDLLSDFLEFVVVFLFVFNRVCFIVDFMSLFCDLFEFIVDDDDIIDNVCKGFVDVGVVLRFDE